MKIKDVKSIEDKFMFIVETTMAARNLEVFLMKPFYYVKFDEVPEFALGYSEFDEKEKKWKIVIKKDLAKFPVPAFQHDVYANKDDNPFLVFWHELMHCLSNHQAFINKGKDEDDKWLRYFACEYWLNRAHIYVKFYSENTEEVIKGIEEKAPELKDIEFKDLTVKQIYEILKKHRDKFEKLIKSAKAVIVKGMKGKNKGDGEGGKKEKDICGIGGCVVKPSSSETQKEVDREVQKTKQEAMLVDYFKNMGKNPESSAYLKIQVDDYIDWLVRLQQSIFNKGRVLKYLFDVPDYVSLIHQKIIYPIREPYSFDVIFIVDVSSSMSPDELQRCFRYLSPRINIRKVITHNSVLLEVYNSREEFLNALRDGKVKYGGGTDYNQAYEEASKALKRSTVVVHITDGVCDKPKNFDKIAKHLIFLISAKNSMYPWIKDAGCPILYAE